METIEKEMDKQLKIMEDKYGNDQKAKAYEESNKKFEDMVKKGFIQKRGNNLMPLAEAHQKSHVRFNAK